MEGEQQEFFFRNESSSGTLKDLVLRWFSEVQAPLLFPDGTLPGWLHGFITRRQTEELLKDKELGCFLIRLRERAFGYILSYRGKDRCRHFVISCQKNGRYVVTGDTRSHESLTELIRYYQISEIEPFGETLTVACSKPEEKNVYDEISLEQQTPAKQSPELFRKESGRSSTSNPAEMDTASQQPAKTRWKLQEQEKSLWKERRGWSREPHSEDDPDAAPPIPDRSSLLMAEYSEEASGSKAAVYTGQKHLKGESVDNSHNMDQPFADRPPNPDEPGQGGHRRKNTSLMLSDKLDCKRTEEGSRLGTIYSEIGPDRQRSTLTDPEFHNSDPFPLTVLKKPSRDSPVSTPPKLSPKLPEKPKTSMDSQGSQGILSASDSTSLKMGEMCQTPPPFKTFSDTPWESLYGRIHKLKSQKPKVPVADDPYEQIPFEWPKRGIHDREFESRPKLSALEAKEVYEQVCAKSGHSSQTQSYAENMYKKIPVNLFTSLSARQAGAGDDIYEKISLFPGKGAGVKPSQKNDKPRRFLFADKKTKF